MNERHEIRDELADRLTDQALAEILAGRRPPDLTARILAAAQSPRASAPRESRLALAACLAWIAGICGVLWYVLGLPGPEGQSRRVATVVGTKSSDVTRGAQGATQPSDPKEASSPSVADQLARLVDEFNAAMDQKRYDDAEAIANKARAIAPDKLLPAQLRLQAKMAQMERFGSLRAQYEEGYLSASSTPEGSAIPYDDNKAPPFDGKRRRDIAKARKGVKSEIFPVSDLSTYLPAGRGRSTDAPILYPDAEVWRALTERRKKWKTIDPPRPDSPAAPSASDWSIAAESLRRLQQLAETGSVSIKELRAAQAQFDAFLRRLTSPSSAKAAAALDEATTVDFVDTPLSDVVEYLKTYHGIEMSIDVKALHEAGVAEDAPITASLRGTALWSTLRHILRELDLTYVIRDGGIEITSKAKADQEQFDRDLGRGPGEAGDRYSRILENPFLDVLDHPLSTFSADVDTASYAKVRRYLMEERRLPPPDAVRIEELVNYFTYDYAPPDGDVPFAAHVEVAGCPWQPEHRLVRIGLKGREIPADERPASNLVFLLDVSGSMDSDDKLPRVRRAMQLLVEQLRDNDRVAIVVYAAATGLVLPSTPGFEKNRILAALDGLAAGGSTNGGDGIRLAYDVAEQHFIVGGTNRVILCTDGDFNVGTTSTAELERLIEERAKSGVFLTVLGFGMGNHNDEMMEKLADKGNGNYGYVDSEQEARKLLVEQAGGTLVTIAKDVKLQLEFNPRQVAAYRLIGYEDRLLAAEDFNDDKKDAGEIGAGHTVTALYELVPAGKDAGLPPVDELKYQRPAALTDAAESGELLTLKLRYKEPDGQESKKPLVKSVCDEGRGFAQASADFQFASAIAGFGLLLRDSQYKGNLTYDAVIELARPGLAADRQGRRAEFVNLVRGAKTAGGGKSKE